MYEKNATHLPQLACLPFSARKTCLLIVHAVTIVSRRLSSLHLTWDSEVDSDVFNQRHPLHPPYSRSYIHVSVHDINETVDWKMSPEPPSTRGGGAHG